MNTKNKVIIINIILAVKLISWSYQGKEIIWTKEDYANHFIGVKVLEITATKEKFANLLKDETARILKNGFLTDVCL